MLPGWKPGLRRLQLAACSGPPMAPACCGPGEPQPFPQSCLCRVVTSGWLGRGERWGQESPGSPQGPACTVFPFAVSRWRVAGPLRQALLSCTL